MPDVTELSNPHDRFFKEIFSRPEVARDFLQNYRPAAVVAQLDLSTLELRKDSFIPAYFQPGNGRRVAPDSVIAAPVG